MTESIMNGLGTDNNIKEDGDSLGGFQPHESGLYDCTIKAAFITLSQGKAKALNVHFTDTAGKEIRQTFWMTSGEHKGCKNFYINKKTQEKHYLPGFNMANALCLLTVGKQIGNMAVEDKLINLYDPTVREEVASKVSMLMELLGENITIGVIKQKVDKRALDPVSKTYLPTGETRMENEVDKIFRQRDGLTVTEVRAKVTEAVFKDKWGIKHTGVTQDKSDPDAAAKAGSPATAESAPSGKAAPQEDLFA